MEKFFRSIRGRLFLTAAAVAIPALLLAGWLILEAHQGERRAIERQMQETARALSLVVDRQLGQAEALLRALATSPAIEQEDWEAFHAQAVAALGNAEYWIVLSEAGGRQIINTYVPFGHAVPQTSAHRDFERTRIANGPFVSSLFPSQVYGGDVLSVGVPVRNREGEIIYGLALTMPPTSLSTILGEQHFPSHWVAAIIDSEGIIAARNRRPEDFIGSPATADIRKAIQQAEEAIVESTTLDGDRVVAAFRRAPGTGWTVIVGAPKSAVFASAGELMLLTLVMSLFLVGIGIGVSVWARRGVIQAMQKLVAAAKITGTGAVPMEQQTGMTETDEVARALRDAATQLQQREAQLRHVNESLEESVRDRTHELAEANRALASRNQELNDFAHVASHDLQEPLRQIRSFAGIVQTEYGGILDEDGKSYLQRITAAGERMSRLIRDLLAYSQISTRRDASRPVNLNQILADVLSDLEIRLRETGGRVIAGNLPTLHGDPSQMHQLLLNLIGNALKFHREGVPPVVTVEAKVDSGVRIIVEDNGIGFDSKHASRIFAPFQRLHGRDTFEGTGIGLAIVRRIAEFHEGRVEATGRPNEGSRFEIIFPKTEGRRDMEAPLPSFPGSP